MAKYKIIPSSRTIVRSPISIGHKAEKGVEAIEFDLTAWVETYGSGTLTVIMRRWGDAIPYPIALEIDENNKATWTLSDIDTAKAGMAYAQLNYIVGDEVVKKSDIYTFRVMDSLTGEGEPPEAYESWLEHLTRLAAEAMADVLDIEGIVTDKTLTVDGGIADAKKTGDEISSIKADLEDLDDRVEALEGGSGGGLTPSIKNALLACLANVAWKDDNGQTYYDALEDALFEVTLTGITAVYTQSGTVYSDDSLDGLKSDLVVTALYDNGTSQVLTDSAYTLTGNLNSATSTITVAFSGKTATFNVSVTFVGSTEYADDLANWFLTRVTGAATYSDGKITIKGSQTNADAYKLLCLDRAKTLWDTVNGKKLRIRVTMDSPDWVGEISTEKPQNRVLVGLAIYKNSTINTGNDRQKIKSLAQILPLSTPTTYEFVFDADIENFDSGSGTPTSVSTFGVSIYNVSANTLEITGCSIVEVLTS